MAAPGCTLEWPLRSIEQFYEQTAGMFVPGGPGRVRLYLTDAEIVALMRLTYSVAQPGRRAADGALFVVPTPAGVVAILRAPSVPDLERELRPGRHDCGYARDGLVRTPTRGARRMGVSFEGDAIVRAHA